MALSGNFLAHCSSTSPSSLPEKYIKFVWSAVPNKLSNTSTITWQLLGGDPDGGYVKAGAFKVVIDGTTEFSSSTRIQMYTDTVIASGTKTITHKDDGSRTFAVHIEAAIYHSGVNTTGDANFTLDTIPRASSFAVANGTLDTPQNLTVTKQFDSFTHTITWECGSASGKICDKSSATSISFALPLDLAKQNKTGTSVSVKFTLQTYSGTTTIGSAVTKTVAMAIPEKVVPSCSLSVSDTAGHFAKYGAYVKGLSSLAVTVNSVLAYESPIISCSTTVDGATYTTADFSTEALKSAGTLQIESTIRDNRGRIGFAKQPITVLDYVAPSISNLSVHRCDQNGNEDEKGGYVKVTFSAVATALNNLNSVTYTLKYKKSLAEQYTEIPLSVENPYKVTDHTYRFAADTGSSYDIEITVADNHNVTPHRTSASTAFTLMHFKADGTAMAVGKVSETPNVFEVGLDTHLNKNAIVGGNVQATGSISGATVSATGAVSGASLTTSGDINGKTLTTTGNINAANEYLSGSLYVGGKKSTTDGKTGVAFGASGNVTMQGSSTPTINFITGSNTSAKSSLKANASGVLSCVGTYSAGKFRIQEGWIGMYSSADDAISASNRYGFFGYDNGTSFQLYDGKDGILIRSAGPTKIGTASAYKVGLYDAGAAWRPEANGGATLGSANYKWGQIYSTAGSISTSDRNQKENIKDLDERYINLFDSLQPVSYEFVGNEHDRVHVGFIAQDIKAAMEESGLSDLDFAAYCRDEKTVFDEETQTDVPVLDENGDPEYIYSLRYAEFIALNTKMIQMNRKKIAEQQAEIDELKKAVAELTAALKKG